jgi:hypothetical protein
MSVAYTPTLRGQKIPTIMATGGVQVPLLTPDSPITHHEAWNWKTFAECIEVYSIDHPQMFPEAILFACLAECEQGFKKVRIDGRSLGSILMLSVCLTKLLSPVEGVQSR